MSFLSPPKILNLLAVLSCLLLQSQDSSAFAPSQPLLKTAMTTTSSRSQDQCDVSSNPFLKMGQNEYNKQVTVLQASAVPTEIPQVQRLPEISPLKAALTKAGMMTYIASMCVALPVTLLPAGLIYKAKLINKKQKEILSLRVGQFCSRWLMRVIPFAKIQVMSGEIDTKQKPEPAIWVCNHNSMLDIFVLLATDKKLRGGNKRPIKIVYWKDLEKNPVTGLLFKMCGFLPVEMEDNGNGNANQYKTSSFKSLLRGIKQAFDDGFDIGILPEGQINPFPEKGLQPVFPGAFTLARMSKRPIRMMGMYGLHKLWHVDGMNVTGRNVKVRAYPLFHKFESGDEFVESFTEVIGHFGAKGEDHPEWQDWLNGNAWNKMKVERDQLEKAM